MVRFAGGNKGHLIALFVRQFLGMAARRKKATSAAQGSGSLTNRQRAFVREYLLDLNATQAAIRAGYSAKNAAQTGAENLRKPQISAAVKAELQSRDVDAAILRKRILRRWEQIAFADPRRLMTWGSEGMSLKQSDQLSDEDVAQVRDVSYVESEKALKVSLKRHDSMRALELLGKHLGLLDAWAPTEERHTPLEALAVSIASKRQARKEPVCTRS